MMEKRNIRLLVLLAVLTTATATYGFLTRAEEKEIIDPAMFRLADVSAISHVVLESTAGKIDLRYDGIQWKVNDAVEADPQLIKVLMATILQVAPKRPVARQQRDAVEERLKKQGVKVSFFAGEVLEKAFLAGGNPEKTEAYFQDQNGGMPYRMTIPGYRVYAAGIFEVDEYDWRVKRIFNFNWRNFRSLKLVYPSEPASDFEIAKQSDFLGVVGLDKPDSTRVNTYLNDAMVFAADKIIAPGSDTKADSILSGKPYLTITVDDIAKRTYRLDLFAATAKGGLIVGKTGENQIVLFDRKNTFRVIKKKEYFRVK